MRIPNLLILCCAILVTIPSQGQRKKETHLSEQAFIEQNFPIKSPSKWVKGEPFIYTLKELNIMLKRINPVYADTTNYQDKHFEFDSFKQQTDWSGKNTLDLIFSVDGQKVRFETGKSLQQFSDTTYNPLIPGLIWLGDIQKADSLMKGQTYFIRTSDWTAENDSDLKYARKFVPVTITAVQSGDEITPVRICFRDQEGRNYSILTCLSGTINNSSRNTFVKIFSFTDPQLKHKEILPEIWKQICAGRLSVGMTQEEARLSIGRPTEINRIPTYSGMHEQWSYSSGTMIRFQDGRITEFRQ